MKDYTIISERSVSLLMKSIKPYLVQGWVPTGGVSIVCGSGFEMYFQALMLPFNAEGFRKPH